MADVFDIRTHPVHLGLGARAAVEPEFTGTMDWYVGYGQRHGADGVEGRLVAVHTFSQPWSSWEVHPRGEEVVICLAGRLVLHQQMPSGVVSIALEPWQGVVNPAGVWHTADVEGETTALFITAGEGTEVRERTAEERFEVDGVSG